MKQAYDGRKVLITGHTGFKGGWLCLLLKEFGADITGYSLDPPSNPNLFEAIGLSELVDHYHGDLLDHEHLTAVMEQCRPDMVFHLAAQPLVRLSYRLPRETYQTNVIGTVNLLEAVRSVSSVRAVVNITSDKCYENREQIWGYREDDRMGGFDPYSSSKGCAELVTAAYTRSFFPPEKYGADHRTALASVRAGNVLGGGDWGMDRLIPDCVRALHQGEEIVIRSPRALRPWQLVLEPLTGYAWLGARLLNEGPRFSGAWNFGPPGEDFLRVGDVVQEVIGLWGNGRMTVTPDHQYHEAGLLWLDCTKSRVILGFEPVISQKECLAWSIEWYKAFYQGRSKGDMLSFSRKQTAEYLRRLPERTLD